MSNDQVVRNQIWLDGVELVHVVSGDVSAAEERAREAIASGGGWFTFPHPGGHYTIRLSVNSSVVVSYVG